MEQFERVELLFGKESLEKLKNSSVLVFGVGGVGSYCIESLARTGIGNLILVDADVVAASNLNRQIMATYETVGLSKCEVMKTRIASYNKYCKVSYYNYFYNEDVRDEIFNHKIDFVVDAIDTITSKLNIIETCLKKNIPFISSLGMANRIDPTKLCVIDLMKTNYDPLAKVLRQLVRKKGLKGKIPVVFSHEHPIIQHKIINENGVTRKEKMPPASTSFVPATAGMICASYCVQRLLK